MKKLFIVTLILFILMSFSLAAYSQEAQYNKLNAKLAELYQKGKKEEAIKVAKQALEVAKKTFGEKHPYVSASLDNIAMLYISDGKYGEAEKLYEQSLKIAEARLGKYHPHLASILENMITCYEALGKTEKAEMLEARLDKIRE